MIWRVWLAFETKPGVTRGSQDDRSPLWRSLAASCRGADGKLDTAEYERWLDCITDRPHAWGAA